MRPRISIRGSVRPSVRRSVTLLYQWADYGRKQSKCWKILKQCSELSRNVPKCPKCPKIPKMSQNAPKCPNISTSGASLSKRTCFFFFLLYFLFILLLVPQITSSSFSQMILLIILLLSSSFYRLHVAFGFESIKGNVHTFATQYERTLSDPLPLLLRFCSH